MPKPEPSAAAAAHASSFKRGWMSLNFKFSAATGALLLALLFVVGLVVNQELRTALTREVTERAATVARNLATKIVEPLTAKDDLTLPAMLKDSIEESPAEAPAELDPFHRISADLKSSFNPASEIKNEGIQLVIVSVFPQREEAAAPPAEEPGAAAAPASATAAAAATAAGLSPAASALGLSPAAQAGALSPAAQASPERPIGVPLISYDALSSEPKRDKDVQIPDTRPPDPLSGDPLPTALVDGRPVYEITVPVSTVDANGAPTQLGEVRLYLRQNVITDAVRVATTRLAAVMLLLFLLGILLLWLVVRFLFAPVGHLVRGVNAVAAGDFKVNIGIRRGDELGDLVEAYNGMAKSLAEKEAVQEALAKYTSKDLVNQMLSDKAKLDLGGQKVHATVLFTVVRGMHALSQSVPAEEYVALINEYLEVETDAIMRNNGSIDKFIGDEVMAVWLLPRESAADKKKEAATQAVKAALELQQAIEKLNSDRIKRGDQPFLVSVGINAGEVVSGNMGSSVKMDYTVLGANVNLAARLGLVAAQGGQIIVSEAVFSQVSDRFKFDKLAPMQLKGIKEPVPLFWPRQALAPRS